MPAETAHPWPALLPAVAFTTAAPRAAAVGLDDHARALARLDVETLARRAAARDLPLTVVVNDAHRFTDTRAFLDALLPHVPAHGAPRLRLLIAAGSHRAAPAERAAHEHRALGPWAARFTELRWHDAEDGSTHARIGAHTFHRWMSEGGCYLACGSMEPHYFAGITGGHKTLTVGVMAMASLTANHAHALAVDAAPLRLDGNPVHQGIVAALADLERAGASLHVLNQVIVDGTVVGCTAGAPLAALHAGAAAVRRCFAHVAAAPVDLVVAAVAPPLDRDLYQADKGIKNVEGAVRDGGTIIVEAACPGGLGLDRFVALLRAAPTHAAALATVRARGYRLGDHKAVRLRALTDGRGVGVALLSPALDPRLADVLGVAIFAERRAAAAWAARRLPPGARGIVVRDAGNVVVTPAGRVA